MAGDTASQFKYALSSSYGNDSIAMIQWAREADLENVAVVFVDTGWSAPGWLDRVSRMESWVRSIGFHAAHIKPEIQFEELMEIKKGFPSQRFQWCSGLLKGIPFLNWIDEIDKDNSTIVMIGKRREESKERAKTPEFVESSVYHGGRRVWHPLYAHTASDRDELLARAGVDVLLHRSKECSPCINSNKSDLRRLNEWEINRTEALEAKVGKTMFRQKSHGNAKGIRRVVAWAYSEKGQYNDRQELLFNTCSSGYCGF
jgi:3'-phosphoadenosine 5'-phosphosulfate sulfotransferase (PAPS reductase)/FAD synthetase